MGGEITFGLKHKPGVRINRESGKDLDGKQRGEFFQKISRLLENVLEGAVSKGHGAAVIRPPLSDCIRIGRDGNEVQIWVNAPRDSAALDVILQSGNHGNTVPLVETYPYAPAARSNDSKGLATATTKTPGQIEIQDFIAVEMQKGTSIVRITAAMAQRFKRVLKREELVAIMQQTGVFDIWSAKRAAALNASKTTTTYAVAETVRKTGGNVEETNAGKDEEINDETEEADTCKRKTPLSECLEHIIAYIKAHPDCNVADIAKLVNVMGARVSVISISSMLSRWRTEGIDIPRMNKGNAARRAGTKRYEQYKVAVLTYVKTHDEVFIEDIAALPEFKGKKEEGIKRILGRLRMGGVEMPKRIDRRSKNENKPSPNPAIIKKTLASQRIAVIDYIKERITKKGKCTPDDVLTYLKETHGIKTTRSGLKARLSQWRRAGSKIPRLG